MKTTKIMKRQMGDYEVLQRTSDSYFDLITELADSFGNVADFLYNIVNKD